VGAHWERARETAIIPENLNESKGLLPTVVVRHALERTDFFGQLPHFGQSERHGSFRPLATRR
jgi:hypothetical protein